MRNLEKLEKAIPICKKSLATAEEILKGCGGVCRIVLEGKGGDNEEGLLSCSIGSEGYCLAVCLWKDDGGNRFEKLSHFKVGQGGLIMLEGFLSTASHLGPETTVKSH